jgi:hypothetical protein
LYRFDQRLRRARVAQIERDNDGLASFGPDRRRNVFERRPVAAREQEIATLAGKGLGNAAPDAAARSGHERNLALQPQLHSSLPLLSLCLAILSHWRGRG